MNKLAYNDIQKVLYSSKKRTPFLVDVPVMQYLCFQGEGHPAEHDFQVACEALFTLSYLIKFEIARKQMDIDYSVNPMEVTWFLNKEDESISFTWEMMIMQPDFVTEEMVKTAILLASKRGKSIENQRVLLKKVNFGKCIQCFHKGDYKRMNDTLANMRAYAHQINHMIEPYTHDIYLNDSRKTRVENYQTIMRVKVID